MKHIICFLIFLALVSAVDAQVVTGTLLGSVTDSSGAAVAGAKIAVTNTGTNVVSKSVTTPSGEYEVPYLQAGQYEIVIEVTGFKKYRQTGLTLGMDTKVRVDVKLEVGDTSQSVDVVGNTDKLQSDSVDLSRTISQQEVESLPSVGRNAMNFLIMAPGVVPVEGGALFANPNQFGYDNRNQSGQVSVNGSRTSSSEYQLDGAPNADTRSGEIVVLPSMDAIAEMKIVTNNYSAEFGRAAGGVVMMLTKSGTNSFHGSIYDDFRNSALNANTFANNSLGRNADGTPIGPKGQFNVNNFGFSLGGPAWFPKIYNGHDRTFFFVSYEGNRAAKASNTYTTVPTALERIGDFSKTFAQVTAPDGSLQLVQRQIYLPLPNTTTVNTISPGQYQLMRQQAVDGGFVNKIPQQYLNPVSLKMLSYYPLPNITPLNADGTSNYFFNGSTHIGTNQIIAKVDQNFSESFKSFFRFTVDWWGSNPANLFQNTNPAANPNWPQGELNPTFTMGHTWIISPRKLVELRANVTRINWNGPGPPSYAKVDLQSLGFTPQMISDVPFSTFPAFRSLPYSNLGSTTSNLIHSTHSSVTGSFTRVFDRWTIKAGGELRVMLNNYYQALYTSMAFQPVSMTQQCSGAGCPTLPVNVSQGYSAADFLLGAITGQGAGGIYISGTPALALKSTYTAFYVQNDWKASRNLTVNLGGRWDYQVPLTERYNRLSNFDPSTNNVTGTPGVYVFTGTNGVGRGQSNSDYRDFGPRVGLAYRAGSKTVIRAAYGISYDATTGVQVNTTNFGADTFTYPSYMSVLPSTGPTQGLNIVNQPWQNSFTAGGTIIGTDPTNPAYLGRAVSAVFRNDFRTPYMQQWNFAIEHEVARLTLLRVAYVGSKGTRLPIQFDALDGTNTIPQATLQMARNQFVQTGVNPLSQRVPNPFFGIIQGNATLNAATITQQALDVAFPAYSAVSGTFQRFGSSNYNALQATFRREFSHGSQMTVNYVWSKSIDFGNGIYSSSSQGGTNTNFTVTNLNLDRSVSYNDIPHRLVASYVAEVPFGRGHKFLSKTPVLSRVLGGWKVSGITTFSSGIPTSVSGGGNGFNFPRPDLVEDPVLPAKYRVIGDGKTAYPLPDGTTIVVPAHYMLWFNPHAFRNRVVQVPVPGQPGLTQYATDLYWYGTSPRFISNLRQPGTENWDIALSRTFRLNEKLRLEFRGDAQNAFNHNHFSTADTAFGSGYLGAGPLLGTSTSTTFGMINTAAPPLTPPRYVQLSVRIAW